MRKIDALTGIRALAALWVVLFHLRLEKTFAFLNQGFWSPILERGYLGVDLFFILSGFVISYVYLNKMAQGGTDWLAVVRFYFLRVARVMPLHWAMLFLYLLAYGLNTWVIHATSKHMAHFTPVTFFLNLLAVHGWGLVHKYSWNYPSWSVSAEWFAYLCFPLMVPMLANLKGVRVNLALISGIVAFMFGFSLLLGRDNFCWTLDFGLVRIMTEFLIGCALYRLFQAWQHTKTPWDLVALASLAGLAATASLHGHDVVMIPLFGLLILSLSLATGQMQRLLGNRVMIHLGEISYAVYMVHAFVLMVLGQVQKRALEPGMAETMAIPLMLVYLAVILLAAQLAYQFIEKPSREILRARMEGFISSLASCWRVLRMPVFHSPAATVKSVQRDTD